MWEVYTILLFNKFQQFLLILNNWRKTPLFKTDSSDENNYCNYTRRVSISYLGLW